MKSTGLILAIAIVITGCATQPRSVMAMAKPSEQNSGKQTTAPNPKPKTQLHVEDLHAVYNKILQDVDPDDLVRIVDKFSHPDLPKVRFKRADFGISRVVSVVNHHPGPNPRLQNPDSVDSLHALHQNTVKEINKNGYEVESRFIDYKSQKVSEVIRGSAIATAGIKKHDDLIITDLLKQSKSPLWNGYVGSVGDQSLYIYPIKPERETCAQCHAITDREKPISYIAHLIRKTTD